MLYNARIKFLNNDEILVHGKTYVLKQKLQEEESKFLNSLLESIGEIKNTLSGVEVQKNDM